MKINKIVLLSIGVIWMHFSAIHAQTISSKIVDKKTNQPIPYATVQIGKNQGVVTNEEGMFSISFDRIESKIDSIHISSMGYTTVGVAIQNTVDSIIYIEPKAIELKSVFVSNKNLSIDEIIDNVDDNMKDNYRTDLTKSRLFFRETNTSYIKKVDVKFKKSTIEEVDKKLE